AKGALDDHEVELQVRGQLRVQSIEQVAAELLATGTGQAGPVPDGAQDVDPTVGPAVADVLEPRAELGGVAEGLLHPGRLLGARASARSLPSSDQSLIPGCYCKSLATRSKSSASSFR